MKPRAIHFGAAAREEFIWGWLRLLLCQHSNQSALFPMISAAGNGGPQTSRESH
jgi:hypothetical protein